MESYAYLIPPLVAIATSLLFLSLAKNSKREIALFEPVPLEESPRWFQRYVERHSPELLALGFQIDQHYRMKRRSFAYSVLYWNPRNNTVAELGASSGWMAHCELISIASDGRVFITACLPNHWLTGLSIKAVGPLTPIPIQTKSDSRSTLAQCVDNHCHMTKGYAAAIGKSLLPVAHESIAPFNRYAHMMVYQDIKQAGRMSHNPYDDYPDVMAAMPTFSHT